VGFEAVLNMLAKMLKLKGVTLSARKVEITQDAFTRLGQAATMHGAEMIRFEGGMKGGNQMFGLMIVLPAGSPLLPSTGTQNDNAPLQLAEIST
jgi:hypothetical protein